MKASNILLLSALSFASGAMLAIFFIMNVLGPKEALHLPVSKPVTSVAKTSLIPAPIKEEVLDLQTEIQPHSLLTPAPQTSNLLPRPDEARQIIDLLRSGFLDSASLISLDLNEQNLNDLLVRLSDKVKISEEAVITPDPKQLTLLELLPYNIGYWRPAELSARETERAVSQWELWKKQDLQGLILDLRNFKDANDLTGAVSLCALFSAPQTQLFRVEGVSMPQQIYKTEHQPLEFKKAFPLIVLVNQNTRGTGEALAWSLREFGGAILVGQPTAGEGGLFTETRLKSGRFLRMASARLITSTQVSLLGSPLQPDIMISSNQANDRAAFTLATRSNLRVLISEPPAHPRESEADLIGFEPDPKTDLELKPKLRDTTLQRGIDVLRGIVLSQNKPVIDNT